jgi:hypothetical protein
MRRSISADWWKMGVAYSAIAPPLAHLFLVSSDPPNRELRKERWRRIGPVGDNVLLVFDQIGDSSFAILLPIRSGSRETS